MILLLCILIHTGFFFVFMLVWLAYSEKDYLHTQKYFFFLKQKQNRHIINAGTIFLLMQILRDNNELIFTCKEK